MLIYVRFDRSLLVRTALQKVRTKESVLNCKEISPHIFNSLHSPQDIYRIKAPFAPSGAQNGHALQPLMPNVVL